MGDPAFSEYSSAAEVQDRQNDHRQMAGTISEASDQELDKKTLRGRSAD